MYPSEKANKAQFYSKYPTRSIFMAVSDRKTGRFREFHPQDRWALYVSYIAEK